MTTTRARTADGWDDGVLIGLERLRDDPSRPFDRWAPIARPSHRTTATSSPPAVCFDVCVELGSAPRLA